MFNISVNSSSVLALIDSIAPRMRAALLPVIKQDAASIQARAKSLASGDVLQEKTGRYVKSIKERVYDSKKSVLGKVYSRDPRAALFEFGGSTGARDILPDVAKALAFLGSAGQVYAAIVHRPVVQYKPHSVIHEAFEEMKSGVEADIHEAGLAAALDVL